MAVCHHVPRLWLMTDERLGDAVAAIVRRLPPGSGIVFRHYDTPARERRRLFASILWIARARRLVLIRAGADRLRGEMGTHARVGPGIVTWPVHTRREAVRARFASAVFVSPVFATQSHPDAMGLGVARAVTLARASGGVKIALGGMNDRRFRRIAPSGFDGWAGIDAFRRRTRQKRNAVPT